ncbi:hypothetical protein C485_12733 [Natrinema altunense JCM 12890]|uniref:Uncharacterized protein n=1 Tax=Natrinema altunense (strain JCM 12890 / CGMCC 1.3731 / AJ2) TaxID=1227494 RepID=L9ZJM5_NATA2|nr:hypothetical protein C485_12733 [Natrinema altunense JCM 12890]
MANFERSSNRLRTELRRVSKNTLENDRAGERRLAIERARLGRRLGSLPSVTSFPEPPTIVAVTPLDRR